VIAQRWRHWSFKFFPRQNGGRASGSRSPSGLYRQNKKLKQINVSKRKEGWLDSGKLIEELFVAVKRAEKEATRTTTKGTGNDSVDTSSASDCESQHQKQERRH
jgi:hypothetical protein